MIFGIKARVITLNNLTLSEKKWKKMWYPNNIFNSYSKKVAERFEYKFKWIHAINWDLKWRKMYVNSYHSNLRWKIIQDFGSLRNTIVERALSAFKNRPCRPSDFLLIHKKMTFAATEDFIDQTGDAQFSNDTFGLQEVTLNFVLCSILKCPVNFCYLSNIFLQIEWTFVNSTFIILAHAWCRSHKRIGKSLSSRKLCCFELETA